MRYYCKFYCLTAFILFFSHSWSQDSNSILEKFNNFNSLNPVEKIYIHTDRDKYTPGDTIWMKSYVALGSFHNLASLGTVAHVELIDNNGTIILNRDISLTNGWGYAEFVIPKNIRTGNFVLRAYTKYMRNFNEKYYFRKELSISGLESEPDYSNSMEPATNSPEFNFYPEGGDLVYGLNSVVAFTARHKNGEPIEASGVILNQTGDTIVTFQTNEFGVAKFLFHPKIGQEYGVRIKSYFDVYPAELPLILSEGYSMMVRDANDKYVVTIQSRSKESINGSMLLAHTRGFAHTVMEATGNQNYFLVNLPKENFPSGISHITFFDPNSKVRCERLIYKFDEDDKLDLGVNLQKESFRKREKVEVSLSVLKADSVDINSLSVSVVDAGIFDNNDQKIDIENYLKLSSDLEETVAMPGYIFQSDNIDRAQIADDIMLTNGWRRFKWEEVLNPSQKLEFSPENGYTISGQLFAYDKRDKTVEGRVLLFFLESPLSKSELVTDGDGRFIFTDLALEDSLTAVLQASKVNKAKKRRGDPQEIGHIFIDVDQTYEPETNISKSRLNKPNKIDSSYQELALKTEEIRKAFNLDDEVYILDEIQVSEEKNIRKDPFHSPTRRYINYNKRIVTDSIPGVFATTSIFQFIAGQVAGSKIEADVLTLRRGGVSYMVDDIPTDAMVVSAINMDDISYIDIIMGGNAAIFGLAEAPNVISIYTRKGGGPIILPKGIREIKFRGIYPPIEFSSIDYSQKPSKYIPDFRKVIYWNPNIQLKNGEDNGFSFYTSDQPGRFMINVQGLTVAGDIISEKEYYLVK